MASLATDVEEAVVAALNAATLSQTLDANNKVRTSWTEEDLAELRCVVLVTNQQSEPLTRASRQKILTVEVGCIKRIGFGSDGQLDQTKFDGLRTLSDEIEALLCGPISGLASNGPRVPQTVFDLDQEWIKRGIVAFSVIADFVMTVNRRV